MKQVSIVILNWNSEKYLSRCLESLRKQTVTDFEVLIIDNGSEKPIQGFENLYPDLSLSITRLPDNQGFAAANNIGARLVRGKWLALLNADAFPQPDWLESLLKATQDYPDYSCFSSRLVQANNPEYLDGTGDVYHVSGATWKMNFGYPAKHYGHELQEVFSPCAAAALYLREAFLEVGGFDEDFFSYYEDVDLGFRLQLHGYHTLYVPSAVVHHVGSGTFGAASDFVFYYTQRNFAWAFLKNMPASLFWRYLPAHICLNLFYLLYYTFRGRGRVLWKAKRDSLRGLHRILEKRKEIQKKRRVTSKALFHMMERGCLKPYLAGSRLRRVRANYEKIETEQPNL